MGNIEVAQPSSARRKGIFNQSNTSQYRQSRSPRQGSQHENTNRFTNINRVYKVRQFDGENTSRMRNDSYYRGSQNKIMRTSQLVNALQHSQSLKSNNHSNRIVNFNDFLIEIKKQMTQNSNNCSQIESQLEQTLKKGTESQVNEMNKELKVNIRLQNQRLELDKYKKLVERQLSKSHSIENISLQSKQDNQKLLIIKYGQYPKQQIQQKRPQTGSKASSDMIFGKLQNEFIIPNTNINQKIVEERLKYSQILKHSQRLMKELTERMNVIGQFIQLSENQSFTLKDIQQQKVRNKRICRISSLIGDINHLQSEQISLQNQIKAAIQNDDQSDISETLTQSELIALQKRKGK